MIYIKKLNNETVLLNNDLIETIEETPDTVITLTTGKKILTKESMDTIMHKVIDFKIKISNGNYEAIKE